MTETKRAARLSKKVHAFRRAFLTDDHQLNADGKVMLADLRDFCRADKSTVIVSPTTRQVDPHASMVAEGRREVYLRIIQMLHIDDRLLVALHNLDED